MRQADIPLMTIPAPPADRLDPAKLAIRVAVYVVIVWLAREFLGPLMLWVGGYYLGNLGGTLAIALVANVLALRFFTHRRLVDLGMGWNRASMENMALGILGGAGAATLVLGPALLAREAHFTSTPQDQPSFAAVIFVVALLAFGAMGEELMMRGYGFQILLANCGPWATIIPVGVLFAWLHTANPNATWIGIANTAGFGILFGYAFVRSRDLWLPAGLHFGWNVTLPLFGVNVSGLRMKVTGHDMVWSAGNLWSGGEYGPEASLLTSFMMIVLAVYLWKAPIRRQPSPLTDPPAEPKEEVCES
jgi:membrane protease YdiL (CAAX protease family)